MQLHIKRIQILDHPFLILNPQDLSIAPTIEEMCTEIERRGYESANRSELTMYFKEHPRERVHLEALTVVEKRLSSDGKNKTTYCCFAIGNIGWYWFNSGNIPLRQNFLSFLAKAKE